jgi:protein-S-isoprenylcysteine O-methyltransferase Ste14
MPLLILFWVAWCFLHSVLITTTVKRWFDARGGAWLGLYRLGYVFFSLATLLPLLWYTQTLPQHLVITPARWFQGLQSLLFCYAMILFVGGMRVYDFREFLGIQSWLDYQAGTKSTPPAFTQSGILRYVRHPWYSGGIALLWALPNLTDVTLTTRSILTCYLVIGTLLEEHKLKNLLGEPYRDYCCQVPMLLPWRWWGR